MISILKAGTAVRVGNRNTKKMYESGETAQVASEMKSYTTCLLRLSETRNEPPPPLPPPFPHKLIHKATRRSPDHVTKNQIDHICFVEEDVKVIRGPEQIFHQTPI